MTYSFLPSILAVLAASSSSAMEQTSPAAAATCRQDVDSLQRRIEMNYAGYVLEVDGRKRRQLDDTLTAIRAKADGTSAADCLPLLNLLVAWYRDPHLFVFQEDIPDTTEAGRRRATVMRRDLSEAAARAYFAQNRAHLDPVEGIWNDAGIRIAIVPAGRDSRDNFDAVVISSDTAGWQPGEIRAQLTRRTGGGYDAAFWTRSRNVKSLVGKIYRRVLLRFDPGMWGKEYPVARTDSGSVNPVDAHRAVLQMRGSTVVLSIPSHDPPYRFTLDTLLKANDAALRSANRLIVDLRGNEGGSSWVTNGLLPFIISDPPRRSPYEDDDPVMLSSPNQIAYAKRSFAGPQGPDSSPSLLRLLARMNANPGKLVPLSDSLDPPSATPHITPTYGPKKIAVMVDHGTVSASEVLVLRALLSTRAVVIGEPTEGALDYQSTNIVWFSTLERRWGLGYPTVTRSTKLPLNGMRGVGIKPDVRADWSRIADPVGYVENLLAKRP